jgi:hypothetical protein
MPRDLCGRVLGRGTPPARMTFSVSAPPTWLRQHRPLPDHWHVRQSRAARVDRHPGIDHSSGGGGDSGGPRFSAYGDYRRGIQRADRRRASTLGRRVARQRHVAYVAADDDAPTYVAFGVSSSSWRRGSNRRPRISTSSSGTRGVMGGQEPGPVAHSGQAAVATTCALKPFGSTTSTPSSGRTARIRLSPLVYLFQQDGQADAEGDQN